MLKAKNKNKVYRIGEGQVEAYRKEGYNIYDMKGKLLQKGYSLENEIEALKEENIKLKKEVEALTKKNVSLSK